MLALVDRYSEQFSRSFATLMEQSLEDNPEADPSQIVSALGEGLAGASREASRTTLGSFIQDLEPERVAVREKDGVPHRFNTRSEKTFLTRFGPITLGRDLYYPADGSKGPAHVPLDEAWEMTGRFATPEVVEPVLLASATMDPADIKILFGKLGAFTLSKEAIYDIRTDEGRAIHDWIQTEAGLRSRLQSVECPEQTTALVAGLDGANLPLREPGPKRGRPAERPRGEEQVEQPKQSCYKNAMVGSFSFYGTAEVIDIETGEARIEPSRFSSCYTAQMPQDRFGDFKAEFEATLALLEERSPADAVKMLLLDGGRPLWGYIHDHEERFAEYEKVLDYFHATEHLSLASEAIFGKKSEEGAVWYRRWCTKLKHDEQGVDGLIRSMNYLVGKGKLSKSARKLFDQQLGFFRRNRRWMNYGDYTRRGLPIGSGPTEAACKTIVKERMCRSGMRWSREKGKSVLALRAIAKSKQWDETWKDYHDQCWDKAA